MRLLTIGMLAAALLVPGCSKETKSGSDHKAGHDHSMHAMDDMHGAHMGHDHGMHRMAQGGAVAVPKDGKKFTPPIKPAQLPAGVWYCEMGGTVHYARGDKGDGKCPLCHMKLKHK